MSNKRASFKTFAPLYQGKPILAAVQRMHRDDDNARDPYNTVRPLDVIEWTPTASSGAGAPMGESVTMWTDENGLDCYTKEQLPALEDKSCTPKP